ncbi:hypothetical protein GALMADRAFT_134543 [Galerina marginata CBS 339.88]|uniref:Uncharacterized protein n=1 Tax=Galerina marginata (strain CBS 339.88) TaxID=685588 RepID=A0A067TL33_GALM3|nr:hypothetical protein GALMADRAFT_134543 [Galerina marginata CBS 339.88]
MANRRAPQQKLQKVEKSEGDFDFPMSQESNGVDESQQALMETLAKHYTSDSGVSSLLRRFFLAFYLVEMEKKKAQKEKKFLAFAENQLNIELETSTQAIKNAMNEVDRLYAAFLLEHASCEDRIRKKWEEIKEQQDILIQFVVERQKSDDAIKNARSSRQASGLSKTKAASKGEEVSRDPRPTSS